MKITFDRNKNALNIKKHGISLADVDSVFYDDRALIVEDRDHFEERFVLLGMDGIGRILRVTYHYRGEDEIRVISARLADPQLRRTYEG